MQTQEATRYFKITNEAENHHGFQYKDGLNVLLQPFRQEGSCVPGGLYFTTIDFIHEFYNYGVNLRIVELPTSDPEFKMVGDPEGNKWRANKIILGAKYSLADPATYIHFGLNISVDDVSAFGYIDVLNWLRASSAASGVPLQYTEEAMNEASANGHVHILQWWLDSNLELKYSPYAFILAKRYGRKNVLKWWKESGLTGY